MPQHVFLIQNVELISTGTAQHVPLILLHIVFKVSTGVTQPKHVFQIQIVELIYTGTAQHVKNTKLQTVKKAFTGKAQRVLKILLLIQILCVLNLTISESVNYVPVFTI